MSVDQPQMYPDDQARVDKVTHSGVNATERRPVRLWGLLGVIWLVLIVMSGVSYLVARQHGAV